MPKNPADDQPAPSVQDDPIFHTAAACPNDGTLVMCSGPRGAKVVGGACPVCHAQIYARAELASQRGVLNAPPDADLEAPPKEEHDAKS